MTRVNLLLLTALLLSCLYLVQVAYDVRRLFSALDTAQNQHRALDIEFDRLQAERQSQATPSRVEKTAREKLAMRAATPAVTHYVSAPVGVAVGKPATSPGSAASAPVGARP